MHKHCLDEKFDVLYRVYLKHISLFDYMIDCLQTFQKIIIKFGTKYILAKLLTVVYFLSII